ncbi:hypothetical protein LA345_13110 [Burkholderia vietnamiensis]|uniref:Uncharacterized protein n=1 Tax=Burkholderia vietnamiensis (strain G4 / LMG 22486) TaxID=269482 RepID=A4JFN7_BURVG|nr:hypothetical protein Bcep1808_2088 [Burkholderia vietnamiensis G4]MCB4344852.1 hypothetical protein [Burkholderia vietnamiensis]
MLENYAFSTQAIDLDECELFRYEEIELGEAQTRHLSLCQDWNDPMQPDGMMNTCECNLGQDEPYRDTFKVDRLAVLANDLREDLFRVEAMIRAYQTYTQRREARALREQLACADATKLSTPKSPKRM